MMSLVVPGRAFSVLLILSACSRDSPEPLDYREALRLVADSNVVANCISRAVVPVKGAGVHAFCDQPVNDGRILIATASDGQLVEAWRYWPTAAADADEALSERVAAVAVRLGPSRVCYDQLRVWNGPNWHAIVALQGPDAINPEHRADSLSVVLVVRPTPDAVCPEVALYAPEA